MNNPGANQLVAKWPNSTVRDSDSVGGCLFMCNTVPNCRVGNDGIPVELLQFGVE
jgi:hypothetical protein